ncbi:MAG TPA: GAF domain-containing sensor histidine kinase, partial [Acidimicrobiia bacterium]|nr:GAF domain-containing sensor histidine kinase [Acidimicrobiia bacterium]
PLRVGAAERIAGTHPERIFDLAYHFAAADRPDRAFAYALAAAEQARDQYALDVAEQHYKIAARAVDGADRATQRRVSAGLGEVLTLAGRYDDARRHLDAALELSDEPLAEAELHAQRADLAFKAGELGDAADAAERGLRLLRRRVPRTTAGFVLSVVVEAVVQTLHSLAARWFVARRPLDGRATADLLACRLYSRLAHVAWFVRGPVPTLWAHLREMNLAERYPPTRELAQAYSEHAPASTLVGWHRRGIAYATRSLAIRRRLHDVWGQGQSLNFYGIVLYTAARYTESMEKGREAVRLLQRTGDRWELNIARCHVAYNLMRTGRIAEAVDVAREVHRHGVDIGDREAVAVALDVWAKASGGQAPADAIAAELARPTIDVQRRSHLLQAEAVRLLRAGRPLEAADLLEGAIRETNAAGVRNEYVVAARPWLATALREAVEAMSPYAAGRRPLLRRATRAARAARILARVFPNHRSHALREAGLVAALLGRSRTARRLLLAALEVAQHSGAVTEEFECLEAFEDVAAELGWEIDPAHAARADDLRLRLDIPGQIDVKRASPVTLGLLDRFDTLLDEGRRIAGALSEAVAHRSATRALRNLLRADETSFVDLSRNEAQHAAAALVREAIERRRPVVVDDDPADERADDLLPAGARCALAVPVLVRGEPVGCLYAGHGAMSGMFREDDVRVAELVASITGAALENAQGFAEIEALQRSLEERVSDRTAQLSTMLRELERVNEELRDADRLKTDFVSMVSHELRTPLTPIIGLSSTMLQRWGSMDDALREECLVSIHRQGTRLARLVDDLLEMSRIESGALEAEASIFDVRPVVEAAVASMGDEFSLITVECPDGLQMVTDVDRFHQMLVNYLENARKYGDGPIVVTARSRGEWVEVAVADSGDGVPEEFVGKLFEKFTRFGGSDASGTGLGLSIVRGLARAQGGDAWYEPNRPRGARFCIRLPRAARNVLGDFANGDVASDPGANVSA